jgi:hypothetical protein
MLMVEMKLRHQAEYQLAVTRIALQKANGMLAHVENELYKAKQVAAENQKSLESAMMREAHSADKLRKAECSHRDCEGQREVTSCKTSELVKELAAAKAQLKDFELRLAHSEQGKDTSLRQVSVLVKKLAAAKSQIRKAKQCSFDAAQEKDAALRQHSADAAVFRRRIGMASFKSVVLRSQVDQARGRLAAQKKYFEEEKAALQAEISKMGSLVIANNESHRLELRARDDTMKAADAHINSIGNVLINDFIYLQSKTWPRKNKRVLPKLLDTADDSAGPRLRRRCCVCKLTKFAIASSPRLKR